MRRAKNAYNGLKRACAAVRRWYESVIRFVTRRIVFFPALGAVVFTTVLLALVESSPGYASVAVVSAIAATVFTLRVLHVWEGLKKVKRIVFFPIVWGSATIAVLLAFVESDPWYTFAAVVSAIAAALLTLRVLRGGEPEVQIPTRGNGGPPLHPSKRVASRLDPDPTVEKFYWEGREHALSMIDIRPGLQWFDRAFESTLKWRLWGPIVFMVTLLVVGFAVARNAWMDLLFVVVVLVVLRIYEWHRRYLVFTTRRFLAHRGLLSPRRLQVPLGNLFDVQVRIPWHSKWLSGLGFIRAEYGTLLINVPGDQNEELKETPWVKNINTVEADLTHLTLTLKK